MPYYLSVPMFTYMQPCSVSVDHAIDPSRWGDRLLRRSWSFLRLDWYVNRKVLVFALDGAPTCVGVYIPSSSRGAGKRNRGDTFGPPLGTEWDATTVPKLKPWFVGFAGMTFCKALEVLCHRNLQG